MLGPFLGLILAGAPPPNAAKAEALARDAQWDELYLAFASVKPEAVAKGDRPKVAQALAQGCVALLPTDAVLAQSLGDKSLAFGGPVDAVLCATEAALKADQKATALETLAKGAQRFPKDGRVALLQGNTLLDDADPEGAERAFARVPKGTKEAEEAKPLQLKAHALAEELRTARSELRQVDRQVNGPGPGGGDEGGSAPAGVAGGGGTSPTGLGWESSTDGEGRRMRGNAHFRFRYFNGQRDFGQRAEYEGRVQSALEDARSTVRRLLGEAREAPLDVILYSREEFTLHHGPWAAAAIAGFYSQNAIRMNDSAELTPRVQATLVHEYVHAVFDEVSSFNSRALPVWLNEGLAEWIEWRSLGSDTPPMDLALELKQLAGQGRLPSLAQMSNGPLVGQGHAPLLYALSASAVRLIVKRVGLPALLDLVRQCGGGASFPKAFAQVVGKDLPAFEDELKAELASR